MARRWIGNSLLAKLVKSLGLRRKKGGVCRRREDEHSAPIKNRKADLSIGMLLNGRSHRVLEFARIVGIMQLGANRCQKRVGNVLQRTINALDGISPQQENGGEGKYQENTGDGTCVPER